MATAMTASASPRVYRPLPVAQAASRPSRPMPAPITRVALAARQNQMLALQALHTTSVAPFRTESRSSSAQGSPPPLSPSRSAEEGYVPKRGRKFKACRAPSLSSAGTESATPAAPHIANATAAVVTTTSVPHWAAEGSHPLIDPVSGKRSDIYSFVNDRYPGAPGTALAKARDAQQKALVLAKREAAKKLASKAELEHLGVKGLGKKRKSSSPYAAAGAHQTTIQSSNSVSTPTSAIMSRDASTQSRNRSSAKTSTDSHSLAVPTSSRNRRPTSRATSPAPLVSHTNSSRRSGTRSGSAVPLDNDVKARNSPPPRGSSPPESGKNVLGLASTAPFQSSPLAASAITLEPLLDNDDMETPLITIETSPTVVRSTALKRKASALSQELLVDKAAQDGSIQDDASISASYDAATAHKESMRASDVAEPISSSLSAEQGDRESNPAGLPPSRRASPRIPSRRVVNEVA